MNNKTFPLATYRVQLNRQFTFADARRIVPYLHALGISHVYVSPCLKPRTGSMHGYDIVEHGSLNPELGGHEEFARFVDTLHAHGMGLILDIVPNHMGVDRGENAWWMDVLENGQASPYAAYFDIDWHPIRESLRGKVLLPVLGDHYGKVLEAGELKLEFNGQRGEFCIRYYEWTFPLEPETYPVLLTHELEQFTALASDEGHTLIEWHGLVTDFEQLRAARASPTERTRSASACKQRLATLYAQLAAVREFVDAKLSVFNGVAGQPDSFDCLHNLLEQQSFRLAYWRVAADEVNYRRFFDINELVCLRQDNPEVFEASHRLILAMIADGSVDGLRIDHVDGLWDPRTYCARLQEEISRVTGRPASDEPEETCTGFYLVVEKILADYEHLRKDWPVAGTTGYEFANLVNGLFVHAPSEDDLTRIYARFIGQRQAFDEVLYDRKRQVIRAQMSSGLTTLVNQLGAIAEAERVSRDYTLNGLREALTEVVAYFPVYRTYIVADDVREEDRRFVEWAIAQAKKRSPASDVSIFDFLRDVLLLLNFEGRKSEYRGQVLRFVMKFQQYTAPVMAKSLEDTSFYVYNRLVSLNEVGGDPRRFGTTVAAFHHANQQRLKHWPRNMVTLATHDSKRSGDVRARINVLSELAGEWRQRLSHWSRLNRNKKRLVDGQLAPSRNAEYLLYQTLVGAWPLETLDGEALALFRDRIEAYMLKAVKEAKIHTSWINPNAEYELAVTTFVRDLLDYKKSGPFVEDFWAFQKRIARFGFYNSLAQMVLLLTAPGVPDIYQGTELWSFTLVDPDNRRPVDFAVAEDNLNSLRHDDKKQSRLALLEGLLAHIEDGGAKLFVIWKILSLRRAHPELFAQGDYLPLEAIGEKAAYLCAFMRRWKQQTIIVIVARWFAHLVDDPCIQPLGSKVWGDTCVQIPDSNNRVFRDTLSETSVRVVDQDGRGCLMIGEVLKHFPVALLIAR
jgi:(1->4)-alpha-D-glucan 1-alpha-D-glucosylmutase